VSGKQTNIKTSEDNKMKLSLKEAVERWVGEFNAIPQALIEKAYEYSYELEITPMPKKYECEHCGEEYDKDYFENEAEENEYGDKLCQSCATITCDTCSEEFDKDNYEIAEVNNDGHKLCPNCLEEDEGDKELCTGYLEKEHHYIEEAEDSEYFEYGLPMWGTMWTFGSGFDESWAKDNLEVMADCGFKIFESDELGVFFGINGAGYDFYESHWIPLYKARGLKWHSEGNDNNE
jgi:hypothetical protein